MDLTEKTENINRHPWELSRSFNLLKLFPKNTNSFVYADIGSGDRFFAQKLQSKTTAKVFAIDNEYKNAIVEEDGIICLNNISLLENNSIDCLIMMDVLEHIENESEFFKILLEKLKPNGKIVLTVPAMQFLFSSHDEYLKHYRRYSRKRLLNVLKKNDINIEKCHYFYFTLFILRNISLFIEIIKGSNKKKNVGIGLWAYHESSIINRIIVLFLNIDFLLNIFFNKFNFRLPGLSIIAVCNIKK